MVDSKVAETADNNGTKDGSGVEVAETADDSEMKDGIGVDSIVPGTADETGTKDGGGVDSIVPGTQWCRKGYLVGGLSFSGVRKKYRVQSAWQNFLKHAH